MSKHGMFLIIITAGHEENSIRELSKNEIDISISFVYEIDIQPHFEQRNTWAENDNQGISLPSKKEATINQRLIITFMQG